MIGKNTGRDGALSSLKQVSSVSRGFHSQFVDNSRTFSGTTSSVPSMRWDNLFDDLESQLEAEIGAAEREVHDDVERERQAFLTVHDRLSNLSHNAHCEQLILGLVSGITLTVTLIRMGPDWCAVDVITPASYSGHALIPLDAIGSLDLTSLQSSVSLGVPTGSEGASSDRAAMAAMSTGVAAAPRIANTMCLGFVLRDLARRRRTIEIHCHQGIFRGTLDRVGVDHCDLAEHAAEAARRLGNVRHYRVLALARIALVRIL